MIYVGDIDTLIKFTIDKGSVFSMVYVHTSYNKQKYRMDFKSLFENVASYFLPKEATLHIGHIYFEVVTNKGKFTTKKMVVNGQPVPFGKKFTKTREDFYHIRVGNDSYEEDDYFIIN